MIFKNVLFVYEYFYYEYKKIFKQNIIVVFLKTKNKKKLAVMKNVS